MCHIQNSKQSGMKTIFVKSGKTTTGAVGCKEEQEWRKADQSALLLIGCILNHHCLSTVLHSDLQHHLVAGSEHWFTVAFRSKPFVPTLSVRVSCLFVLSGRFHRQSFCLHLHFQFENRYQKDGLSQGRLLLF